MLKLWEKAPYIIKVLLAALVLVAIVRVARADGTLIQLRQLNSLVRDGATPDTPIYGVMLAGYDGTSAQFLSLGTDGILDVDIAAGGSISITTQADDTANTQDTIAVSSLNYGYESVGGVWDRWRIDTAGNGFVSLGTALDSSIDSISIAVNDVIPQLDSTDHISVSPYYFNAAAGDTQPTATTTQADDLANTLDTLNVTGFLMGWDGTDWDRLFVLSFGDDLTPGNGTDDGLLTTFAQVIGYDEDDTNSDRIYSYDTDGDNVATEAEGVTLAATGFNRLLDEAGTYDRERVSHVAGFYTPATSSTQITADGGEDCTSDNALTAGYYIVQTDATAFCELNADAATAGATTADMRFENPGLYTIMTVAAQDTLCCTVSAGTSIITITAVTFN